MLNKSYPFSAYIGGIIEHSESTLFKTSRKFKNLSFPFLIVTPAFNPTSCVIFSNADLKYTIAPHPSLSLYEFHAFANHSEYLSSISIESFILSGNLKLCFTKFTLGVFANISSASIKNQA